MDNLQISSIRIERLFGLYSYQLPQQDSISNAAILYGDNGVGKSTILRLAFHMLSPAGNRGHRSNLRRIKFKSFEIDLSSGITLSANRPDEEVLGHLLLSIIKNKKTIAFWDYQESQDVPSEIIDRDMMRVAVGEDGNFIVVQRDLKNKEHHKGSSIPQGEKAFLSTLNECVPAVFILTADRRLESDMVPDPSDEIELRRIMRYEEPRQISDLVIRSREIALSQAMSTAARWIEKAAFQGANQGSMNVHAVYSDILRHLISLSPEREKAITLSDPASLIERLAVIESRTTEYARYELTTPLSMHEFKDALNTKKGQQDILLADLLDTYIKSLESRLDALDPIYRILDRFVTIINNLLRDKSINFKPGQGFRIQNRLGEELKPAQLSSGEQQLLLLFCYILVGRDKPSVFMIDEPEISLNIKWQRQLVQSLLDITSEATIQFIFASHSIELLAQHRERVIKLVNKL